MKIKSQARMEKETKCLLLMLFFLGPLLIYTKQTLAAVTLPDTGQSKFYNQALEISEPIHGGRLLWTGCSI